MSRKPFIFVPEHLGGEVINIAGTEAKHLIKTLRVRPGFQIEIFDGIGHRCLVEVVSVSNGEVTARMIENLPDDPLPATRISVAVSIVKSSRMDYAVEKAAETGASRFIPLLTDRSIVSPRERKVERWREIAKSAAKQSRRAYLMEVTEPTTLKEALEGVLTTSIVLSLSDESAKLTELVSHMPGLTEITLFIGAEGGFSDSEVELFHNYNIPFASLGTHTLRTETAVAVSVAIARAQL